MSPQRPAINSLVLATDIDVLAADHRLERGADHWVVRSPSNPTYWWGNFLLFDDAPRTGDGRRWCSRFAEAFARDPRVTHTTLAWDRPDDEVGEAQAELVAAGFELEVTVGLTAAPAEIRSHPRASRDVEVVALDPSEGGDETLWRQVIELQLAGAPEGV